MLPSRLLRPSSVTTVKPIMAPASHAKKSSQTCKTKPLMQMGNSESRYNRWRNYTEPIDNRGVCHDVPYSGMSTAFVRMSKTSPEQEQSKTESKCIGKKPSWINSSLRMYIQVENTSKDQILSEDCIMIKQSVIVPMGVFRPDVKQNQTLLALNLPQYFVISSPTTLSTSTSQHFFTWELY